MKRNLSKEIYDVIKNNPQVGIDYIIDDLKYLGKRSNIRKILKILCTLGVIKKQTIYSKETNVVIGSGYVKNNLTIIEE